MTEPSYDACIVDAELRARAAYAAPDRHYHDERHLEDCLRELDWVHGLGGGETRLLKWAILWHDAVYEPGRADNEDKSAELAMMELERCGIAAADAAEVARLIRLTADHRAEDGDRLGQLLVSIDLAILGADPSRYADYVAAVRKEYAAVDDDGWKNGRTRVLRQLLDADAIYPHPEFRSRLERQARANIQAELAALEA
ncbi:phosphohydrolase [Sphingomonas sabuli]|uniref:Phosphohydrolase n=1 Tax=Sphingomonas sabuli TaxID=2764186 RepID=A0A7G9L2P5_9SPHN|nr:phosphohydrolase [Sphingomonas sabuli]QNM82894.1 phosphohydrolase [Sphingomonas sabuli]